MARSLEDLFTRFATTGDPQALGEVFDRCSSELLPLAMHLTGHPADAEDALQATFVTAIEKRADWDAGQPLLPWLVGILALHGKKLHERRGRRREVPPPDDREALAALAASDPSAPDPEDAPIAASERRELVERLRAHVQALPDEQRSVVLLQLEHGLRPAQIAEALGVPPGTVRMRLHRGLKALRGLLPPALVAWLAAMLPQRGTAAVRQAVLQHAARTVPVAVAVGVAVSVLAKWLTAAVAVVVLVVGFAAWPPATQPPLAVDRLGDSPPAVVADLGAPAPADDVGTRQAAPAASAPLAAAADASELRVRVLRPDESPVSGCIVTLEPARGDVDLVFETVEAATAADGVARFAVAPRAVYGVGSATARARVRTHASGPTEVELRMQAPTSLQRFPTSTQRLFGDPSLLAPVRVTGVVRRPDGAPAAGASLCLTRQSVGTPAVPFTVADADGSFAFEVIGLGMMLVAQAPGFAASELRPCTAAPMTITLQPARGDLVGIVVDADGRPVAGARVRATPHGIQNGAGLSTPERRPLPFVATDRAGGFVVPDLPTGPIDVLVQADGHAPATLVLTDASALHEPVRIVLPRGVVLRGRVVDQDGAPVAGVRVLLGGSYGIQRVTDDDGC
ncbi:MAG: sigma-70 family RNA polymerase sigma factor, partial [Planctomycetes bacterium]|nr:sigma-70 family RNA polymerase sigma factor [Planctomycetota bacterium]